MGRLDNIVRRNQRPPRGEKVTVGIGLALFVLLVIFLLVFTDLGLPPEAGQGPPPAAVQKPDDRRVDGVPMMRARPRAPAAAPAGGGSARGDQPPLRP